MAENINLNPSEKPLSRSRRLKCGALALVTAVSSTFVKAPDVNAANLPQTPEGSQPNRVLVNPEEPQPHVVEIQYPQYKEVVVVTLPPTDTNPKPVSFYAEVLEPIEGQKPNEKHLGWYDQGIRVEGLMGEENIASLLNQERKIDFAENGNAIDCRIVASKMSEEGKVGVEIIWENQATHKEERGWVGIEKLEYKQGIGGIEKEEYLPGSIVYVNLLKEKIYGSVVTSNGERITIKKNNGEIITVDKALASILVGQKVKSLIPPDMEESSTVNTITNARTVNGKIEVQVVFDIGGKTIKSNTWMPITFFSWPQEGSTIEQRILVYENNLNNLRESNPSKYQELQERAKIAAQKNLYHREDFDLEIIHYLRPDVLKVTQANETLEQEVKPFDERLALLTLAWHETTYLENKEIIKIVEEMEEGTNSLNKLLRDKLPPDLFKNNNVPQFPTNSGDILKATVFVPNEYGQFGGGEASEKWVVIFGSYDRLGNISPKRVLEAKKQLSHDLWHENLHRLVQNQALEKGSAWYEKEGGLWHLSMGSIEVVGMKAIGYEEVIDPKLVYLYSVLKRGGVKDPYGLIVQTAATANEKTLLETYMRVKGEKEFTIEELLSADLQITVNKAETEAFKKEYSVHLP